MADIMVPTASGVVGGLKSYGYGAVARVAYNVVSGFTGNGLIGGALAAGVASSVVAGAQGDMIATLLGFEAASSLNPLGGGGVAADDGGGDGFVDL